MLTLYLRRASRLKNPDPARVTIVKGDVLDASTLNAAMEGQNVVYANLAGDMKRAAEHIIEATHATGVKRLVFISSMGIHVEVPGERGSDLDYTILRPGWFRNEPTVSYHLTRKGEAVPGARRDPRQPVRPHHEARDDAGLHLRESLGVSSP